MIRPLRLLCFLLLTASLLPAELSAGQTPEKGNQRVGAQLLSITNEMWFLLSGVVDKKTADAAAHRFAELAEASSRMSDQLFDDDSQALDVEALDQDTYRIAEAYEDLSYEFDSLCQARCYNSPKLTQAFLQAMKNGVFSDDCAEYLLETPRTLNENEARAEISRLKNLETPDRELLRILTKVQDSHSADEAAPALSDLTKKLRRLLPENRLRPTNFHENDKSALRTACGKLEPILWHIRSEIVRIVSLPGYDEDRFDSFSDALDSAFESLGDTHAECFDDIFDASFRADLDDALHESITSSQ